MRNMFIPFIIICSLLSICFSQDWVLIWSDEFNQPGLPDPDKWSYDTGGDGWGNNELQYYTSNRSENARIEDSTLIIEAKKESYSGNSYSSARLVSKNKGDWLYGLIEVRAKLPSGRGTWPAIWMLPTSMEYGAWPSSGEIDIMEHVGYDPGIIHATVHTDSLNHIKGTQVGKNINVDDCSSQFHVYKVEWDSGRVDAYVDNEKYFSFDNKYLDYKTWPFDKKFHLLLNIAIGGSWGGAQGVDSTITSARMYIDYVRVYQQVESRPLSLNVNKTSGGSVNINPEKTQYTSGDQIEITASTQTGYQFKYWSGDIYSYVNPLKFIINSDITINANFVTTGELVINGGFDDGLTQWAQWSNTGIISEREVKNGVFQIRISEAGNNDWDLQLSQAGMNIIAGHKYRISFNASASGERNITVRVNMTVPPHNSWFSKVFSIRTEMKSYTCEFIMAEPGDDNARIEFDFGKSTNTTFIDNISLKDLSSTECKNHPRISNISSTGTVHIKQLLLKNGVIENGYNLLGKRVKDSYGQTRLSAKGLYIYKDKLNKNSKP